MWLSCQPRVMQTSRNPVTRCFSTTFRYRLAFDDKVIAAKRILIYQSIL